MAPVADYSWDDHPPWPDPPPADFRGWWEWLWQHYSKMVFLYAAKLLQNHDEAEEIASQVFLKAGRWLMQNPGALADLRLRPWLTTITCNAVRDLRRRKRPRPMSDLGSADGDVEDSAWDVPDPQPGAPDERALREEEQAALEKCMQGLPAEARELVELRYVGRLKNHEVAGRLGIQPAAAAQRLHRATRQLRDCVEAALAC